MINHGLSIVDEEKRRKFESDWQSGQATAIDEYLPSDQSKYLATLEELVCIEMEFLWGRLSTANPDADTIDDFSSKPTFVEDYTSRFDALNAPEIVSRLAEHEAEVRRGTPNPATEEEFKKRFPEIELDPSLFEGSQIPSGKIHPGASSTISEASLPRKFGSFTLTDVLGRGGMATVYRGVQDGLGREVAIKIADPLATQTHGEEFVRRFMAEAKAAANLTHDHIVPVYEVGEVDGQPFYAMPIINGGDLADQLTDGPLSSKEAATHVRDAARGMATAHAAGVLHRDLKPRNLMIDASNGRTMVADFGLAREIVAGEVGGGDGSVVELTRAGQILGTPAYMPPEQINDARKADARSDIYSLGATLYQAITGRPPFQASSITETLQQALVDEAVAPAQLNTAVDRDLETIVLKSLEKQPEKRYQTANELADDLDRYLEGQPIHARRIGPLGKAAKWCRRNPLVASLTGLLSLAVLFGVVSTIMGLMAVNREQANTLAAVTSNRSLLTELYTELMGDPVFSNQPGETELRQKRIEKSIKHFQHLIEIEKDHPSLRGDLVSAYAWLGYLRMEHEGPAEALQEYRNAIQLYESLSQEQKANTAARFAYSDAQTGLGEAMIRLGDSQAAHAAFEKSLKVREGLAKELPSSVKAARKLPNARMNLGLAKARLNDHDVAMNLLTESHQERLDLLEQHPDNLLVQRDVGKSAFNLALRHDYAGNLTQARKYCDLATKMFHAIVVERSTDGSAWLKLARCRHLNTLLATLEGDDEAAKYQMGKAHEVQSSLAALTAHNLEFRMELIELCSQGVQRLLENQLFAEAKSLSDATTETLNQDVTTSEQAERSVRVQRARLLNKGQQGVIAIALGDNTKGRAMLAEVVAKWDRVRGRFTEDRELITEMEIYRKLVGTQATIVQ